MERDHATVDDIMLGSIPSMLPTKWYEPTRAVYPVPEVNPLPTPLGVKAVECECLLAMDAGLVGSTRVTVNVKSSCG